MLILYDIGTQSLFSIYLSTVVFVLQNFICICIQTTGYGRQKQRTDVEKNKCIFGHSDPFLDLKRISIKFNLHTRPFDGHTH